MSVTVWRIATDAAHYLADDLSGAGGKVSRGRWHVQGQAILYASTSRALACLETLVHLNFGDLPQNRYLVEITLPDALWAAARREMAASLPVGWDAEPASLTSMRIGADWLDAADSALMLVPSVIVPEEFNLLFNPAHPGAVGITARKRRKWLYDTRLRDQNRK